MRRILATLALVSCVGVANAAVVYYDDFSHVTPAPPSGGWAPLTGGFNSDHHYTIGSTDTSPSVPGNFDIVDAGHATGICAGARCIDLDGTNAGHNSYLYSDAIAVNPNTTYQMTVSVGGNKRFDQKDAFLFGFMNAGSNDAIDNAFLGIKDFSWNEPFQTFSVTYTTGATENAIKLFVQNWTSDPQHPGRDLYHDMPNPDDYGVMLQSMTLTTVPLPAAAWLMLSGLAGVAAFSRRRRVSSAA